MGETKIGYRADLYGMLNRVSYVETGGLAEGERIGGRWGYKSIWGYTIQMKKLQKLRSTPRSPVLSTE